MNSITTFQAVVLGIFFFFIVLGVIVFSGISGSKAPTLGAVTIWGTADEQSFTKVLGDYSIAEKAGATSVTYIEKDAATFEGELTNAIASGRAPNLVLLPHDLLVREQDKLFLIPDATFPARTLKDTFAQEGELFLNPAGGSYGVPFSIDPLVMYWNRDLLFGAGASNPPRVWDDLVVLAPRLSVHDEKGTLTRSAAPLGGWSNYANAKPLLSALLFQVGTPIVTQGSEGALSAAIDAGSGSVATNADSALRFYTDFANPSKTTYSWNRSLPEAKKAFIGNSLVLYFGFASEYRGLKAANPNLNFDVAPLPQIKSAAASMTYGRVQALAIPKSAENEQEAAGLVSLVSLLIAPDFQGAYAIAAGIPPARRDLLGTTPSDAASAVFYAASLISRGWLDPDPIATSGVFRDMVESVTSGKSTVGQAILLGQSELSALFSTTGTTQ